MVNLKNWIIDEAESLKGISKVVKDGSTKKILFKYNEKKLEQVLALEDEKLKEVLDAYMNAKNDNADMKEVHERIAKENKVIYKKCEEMTNKPQYEVYYNEWKKMDKHLKTLTASLEMSNANLELKEAELMEKGLEVLAESKKTTEETVVADIAKEIVEEVKEERTDAFFDVVSHGVEEKKYTPNPNVGLGMINQVIRAKDEEEEEVLPPPVVEEVAEPVVEEVEEKVTGPEEIDYENRPKYKPNPNVGLGMINQVIKNKEADEE